MKIYTRSGDTGQTGVIGGRVYKDDIRVEAYGTIDELNCFVGQTISLMVKQQGINRHEVEQQAGVERRSLLEQHLAVDQQHPLSEQHVAVDQQHPLSEQHVADNQQHPLSEQHVADNQQHPLSEQHVADNQQHPANLLYADLIADLLQIQHELFDCGSDLAFVNKESRQYKITPGMITQLEVWVDKYDAEAPAITRFILPGGSLISSTLHICRTVCRRAERIVVSLARESEINEEALKYLNRLSDFLFTAARTANVREGVTDVEYIRSAEVFSQN